MKRLITIITIAALLLMPVSALALAQTSSSDTATITRLQGLANTEINRRIMTLNGLVAIVNAASHIPTADKSNLLGQLNTELASLPALKTKIDADTDLATLKTDILSIRTEFRVYALLVPKVHLVRVADRLSDASVKLTTYATTLQTHIDKAKAAGKNVTSLQTTMTDMQTQISTAQTDFTSVESTIINTTPDQFNASPTITSSMRNTLNAGRLADAAALKDGNSIKSGLEALKE